MATAGPRGCDRLPGGGCWRRGDQRKVVQKRFSGLVAGGSTARQARNSRVTAEHSREWPRLNLCLVKQAPQHGTGTARLLCCHDVSMISGTEVIG